MAGVDFDDRDAVADWLDQQSVNMRCTIANRAAMRVLPQVIHSETEVRLPLTFACMRAVLISAVRGRPETVELQEIEKAALAAAQSLKFKDRDNTGSRAAFAVAHTINSVAVPAASPSANPEEPAAARAASAMQSSAKCMAWLTAEYVYASSAGQTFDGPAAAAQGQAIANSAASWDAENLSTSMAQDPLWPIEPTPSAIEQSHQKFLAWLIERPDWGFWHHWYLGMWEGTFDDWELAKAVALIDDEVWEQGPEAVAAEIELIKANMLAQRAGISDPLVFNETKQTFDVAPHLLSNPEILNVAVERVEDALDDVIALGNGNGLTLNTIEARILNRLLRKYRSDPRRVAFDFVDVMTSIAANIKSGEYPQDAPMKVLQSTLKIGVNEICAIEPDVEQELNRNFADASQEAPTEQDVLVLSDAMRVLPDISEALLERQLGEDVAEVLYGVVLDYEEMNDLGDLLPTKTPARLSTRRRLAVRVANLYSQIRVREKLRAHFDSDRFKEHRVVGTYGGLLGLMITLVTIMAKLL